MATEYDYDALRDIALRIRLLADDCDAVARRMGHEQRLLTPKQAANVVIDALGVRNPSPVAGMITAALEQAHKPFSVRAGGVMQAGLAQKDGER